MSERSGDDGCVMLIWLMAAILIAVYAVTSIRRIEEHLNMKPMTPTEFYDRVTK